MWDIWKPHTPVASSMKLWVLITASIISIPSRAILAGMLIPLPLIGIANVVTTGATHTNLIHGLLTVTLFALACGLAKVVSTIGWGIYDNGILQDKVIERDQHMAIYSQIAMIVVSITIVLMVIADILVYRIGS